MLKASLPCLLVLGLAAGCAPSKANSDVVAAAANINTAPAAAAPVAANASVDGVYRGRSTPVMQSGRCGVFRDPTVRVSNNTVTRQFGRDRLEAAVQQDGTFSTQTGRTTMSGTVRDGHLDAEIGSEHCKYHYSLNRS